MSKIVKFTDLEVWLCGHKLVVDIYRMTKLFPKDEIYGLVSQIRRAAVSVTANIAEGFGRKSYKEKLQFYYQSQGSLTELEDEILIALDVGYLSKDSHVIVMNQIDTTHRLLAGLIRSTKKYINYG
jgi:four helix bundle protein